MTEKSKHWLRLDKNKINKKENETTRMIRLNFMQTIDFEEKKKRSKNLIKIFKLTLSEEEKKKFRFSRKNNLITLIRAQQKLNIVKIKILYKRKNQKIRFVNLSKFDESKFESEFDWKKIVLKDEISKKTYDSIDRFVEYLISKFSNLTKNVKLTFEWLKQLKIVESLWKKKEDVVDKNDVQLRESIDLKFHA